MSALLLQFDPNRPRRVPDAQALSRNRVAAPHDLILELSPKSQAVVLKYVETVLRLEQEGLPGKGGPS